MQRYLVVLLTLISFFSCSKKNSDISIILDKAENCMEEHPDSSLNILNTLQLNSLTVKEDRARYALLKSMALDKNYVDVTSDSLISIALDFYKRYGSPDYKLKAFYYNGKVKMYAGDYDEALENYIKAEKYVRNSSDLLAIARLYNSKMNIYKSIYDIKQAIVPAKLSANYFLQAKDTVRYIRALNSLSSILLGANDFTSLEETFKLLETLKSRMNSFHMSSYYANIINYKIAVKDSTVGDSIEQYLEVLKSKEDIINWVVLARAYTELQEYDKAAASLERYELYNGELSDLYLYFASEVYSAKGNFEKAYKYLKIHNDNSSKEYNTLFKSDAKFLEERFYGEEKRLSQRYLIIILVLIIALVILLVIHISIFVRHLFQKKSEKLKEIEEQKKYLHNEYEKAIIEKNNLKSLISRNKLSKEFIKLLEERLQILNNFIVSDISGTNMEKSLTLLKNYLRDNKKFFHSTIMTFELTHPMFISYLKKRGLTEWEIGCCCLYCIGLNGSEISNLLDIQYFYKQSSTIRKKLDVQSSINIDKFLLIKLKQLD